MLGLVVCKVIRLWICLNVHGIFRHEIQTLKVPGGNSFQDSLRYLNAKVQPLSLMGFNVWMSKLKTLKAKLLKKQSKVQTYNIVNLKDIRFYDV